MNWKRLWQIVVLNLHGSGTSKADWLRKKQIFATYGEGGTYSLRTIPLYPNLIRLHNNVRLASGVSFITHDISDNVINAYLTQLGRTEKVYEKIGCIEIGSNVFVGAGTTILYDVKIGDNCIIGAGSLVTRDIPANSVAVGRPCKVISSFSDYVEKRLKDDIFNDKTLQKPIRGIKVPEETAEHIWILFDKQHNQ